MKMLRSNAGKVSQDSGAWSVCWPVAIISGFFPLALCTTVRERLFLRELNTHSEGFVDGACGPAAPSLRFQTSR